MSNQNLPALTPEDKKFAESSLERAKIQAACYLPTLLETLADRALDPAATNKTILDAAEFTYRVSGMAKKQEENDDRGRFVFNINFGGASVSVVKEKVLEAGDEPDIFEAIPSHIKDILSANPAETTLATSDDVDFGDE